MRVAAIRPIHRRKPQQGVAKRNAAPPRLLRKPLGALNTRHPTLTGTELLQNLGATHTLRYQEDG